MTFVYIFIALFIGWVCIKKLFKLLFILIIVLGGWFTFKAYGAQNLPLPRFASLRSNEVNLRVGPGSEYPVEWVFKQEKMPVEILQEFDTWRKIRDYEGAEGWVHQNMLSGKRTVVITVDTAVLRKKPELTMPIIAELEAGVLGKVLRCDVSWCQIQVESCKGWLPRAYFWGIYPTEFTDGKSL